MTTGAERAGRGIPAILLVLALALAGCQAATIKPAAVQLADTYVHALTAQGTNRPYEVWVSVPASYARGEKPLPVVFVTDATYSFPLVRSIRNLAGQRGRNIEDFILVGLPPQTGLTSAHSRSRDYTPTNPLRDPGHDRSLYFATEYGEADAYLDFIAKQVFALIAQHYRADMGRRVFAGHSYGGLLGSYALLTRPGMFQGYILGSPSLWFDKRLMFGIEAAHAASKSDLKARVFMAAGMYETTGEGPRYSSGGSAIGDMRRFAELLQGRGYPGLVVETDVIDREDHLTVFPSLVSRGLLWMLPGHGPYTGG